jgi:cytochrome P450
MDAHSDPFAQARAEAGAMRCPFHGESITMLLRHRDVKQAARDWQRFSSDAPFRVPIPSEEEVRAVRQLPIETDPPQHGDYRAVVEPFFQRAKHPEVMQSIATLCSRLVAGQLGLELEVVEQLALPLQSLALTHLLNVEESEAQEWIGWGIHVFKVTGGEFKKGTLLDAYLERRFAQAQAQPGQDFFSALLQAQVNGRRLTHEECMGFANLAFAGGRDTIIHTVSCALGHLAQHPAALQWLRDDPKRVVLACEEFFRVFMPLTQIGRVSSSDQEICGHSLKAGERIGLCWASANFDPAVFSQPMSIRLDRKPNAHLSFGFGEHLCLGAPHARLVLRSLLQALLEQVGSIEFLGAQVRVEKEAEFERTLGYESLRLRLLPRQSGC